ncbi:unnamed protein product [Caenorhabditis bovis]|uniref:C2 domain-containing protein n=1 Tax=Caenorhabditis bovis TaxID=2654633 RepID=A0A8S1FFM1_9PELO|nr:unnamed protein product [Caenorhabditis bovis]
MPNYQQGFDKPPGHEWFYLGVGGAAGLAALIAIAALLAVRKRRQYPSLLLPPKQVIAVRGGFAKGPGGLKQSPSPLQSPLSNDSTPSPVVPFQTLLEDRTRKLSPSELPSERGTITFTLSYDPVSLALQVGVINCRHLCELVVSRDGQCLLDPYVKLQLLPEREHRVKTRIVRATTSPQYDEQFTMYGVSSEHINMSTLHFQVVAFDRYSRDTVVGECVYRLGNAELMLNPEMRVEMPLLPRATDSVAARGELLLSLTYQAAFNNLTVVVLKARGLSKNDAGTADPYVKLYLRKDNGERILKKKTHVRRSTLNPVYNESFVFELPEDRLDRAVIDLQVINHDKINRNDVIGRALLNMEDSHVVEVLENPGRQLGNGLEMTKSFPFLLILYCLCSINAYRLNVPRVLLPYHPSVPVSFILEVTHPSGGCFSWRSTRPDVVSVKSIKTNANGCSDKAEIRSVAKPGGIGTSELSAVIFAEDQGSGSTLSCGVTVDEIATISIETTTKVLFVDAAPARMTVDAFNKDGDRFSTLSEIALEWELASTSSNGEKPLRIVPFEQSTYEAPTEIVKLEKNRKKGYVILIEGVGTGTAKLTSKFSDPYLKNVEAHSVELAVVANLLLVPAQDLYMPVNSVVPFQVLIVKQWGTEVVPMPSSSYHLQIDSDDVGLLDTRTSSVRALARGSTAVHLLSSHVDVRAKAGLRPPSTQIHVVDPESVQWQVSGGNWMLQTGKQYAINVEILDEHGNVMFIPDNAKFDTKIDESVMRVDFMSKNGTWMLVTPLKPTKTVLNTKFVAIRDAKGNEVAQSGRVAGEQKATIVEPVRIEPPVIYLPHLNEKKSTINLSAFGGSGIYEWSVADRHIASIETNSGKLIANGLGDTVVKVTDKINPSLFAEAKVFVTDVAGLTFGETARETFVGSDLLLNIKVFGINPDDGVSQISMSDCRNIDVRVTVADSSLMRHQQNAENVLPTIGTGCSTVKLIGLASGDTKVTIYYGGHQASIDVSVYDNFDISHKNVVLGLGSNYRLELSGGPRPWILDPSSFYRKSSESKIVRSEFDHERVVLTCGGEEALESVCITVGNQKSPSLPFPLHAKICTSVCCALPIRLEIFEDDVKPVKCPANVHVMLVESRAKVQLRGHGVCDGSATPLQSINGVEARWKSTNSYNLKIEKTGVDNSNLFAELHSKSKESVESITAEVASIRGFRGNLKSLEAKYDVTITEGLKVSPPTLVLWNEAVSKGNFAINGGSGHFVVNDIPATSSPISIAMRGRALTVTPRNHGQMTLKIVDACLPSQTAEAHVRVADINSLDIEVAQYVEIGKEIEVEIVALDETGATFDKERRALADAQLDVNNQHASLKKIDGLRYILRAESIGTVSLSALAKSTSGRVLTSRPKTVQIFSPIMLQPKFLTLIPEAKFQLEVVGGPQPTPPLDFALNDSKIATVASNALITSSHLGYTSITGTVRVGDGHVTKDSVVLRVVSLSGITLAASARRIETGGRVNLRLRGIVHGSSDEEPFAFGGAIYPFKVTWSVSDPLVLQSVHPLGSGVSESSENQFAIWFDALRSGSVTIKAKVEVHKNAKKHFVGSETTFYAETTVTVEDALSLIEPKMAVPAVRVATNSQTKLVTAWSQAMFSVPSEYSTRVSVSPDGTLTTNGREGAAAISVRRIDSSDNETALIPITVSRVYSLDVHPTVELRNAVDSSPLIHLPVGAQIQLNVVARDVRGRALSSSSSSSINYRPHRFDLTDIAASNNNYTLTITMKSPGETVIRIADTTNSHISTFVRLSASESILPPSAHKYSHDLVVSDVMCLQANILSGGARWSSKSSSQGRIEWIDESLGVGQLAKAGDTFIKLHADEQTIHSKVTIIEPHHLRFTEKSKPSLVVNDESSTYLFSVSAATNHTSSGKLNSIYGDCSPEQISLFDSIRPPFECRVSFVRKSKTLPAVNWLRASPVFQNDVGYACEIRKLDSSMMASGIAIPDELASTQYDLEIEAKWILDATNVKSGKTIVPFHFAMFAEESELVFSNMEQTDTALSVWAPAYDLKNVIVRGCEGDIVTVQKLYGKTDKHSAKSNAFYNVRLNIKSAALFSEHARKCRVVVENTQTGQTIQIPITIQILDETAKQVYNALDRQGFIDFMLLIAHKYNNMIPTMLWTCVIGLVILAACIYAKMKIWENRGAFDDTAINSTIHQTSLASSLSSSANSSAMFRDSPIFRSTPIAGSPSISVGPRDRLRAAAHLGSSGDGRIWSTEKR